LNEHLGVRLSAAFVVLIAILLSIGQLGLRRMQTINHALSEITGKQSANLQMARNALMISNDNNRIAMEIVLVENRALVETLVATSSTNSREITRLIEESESRCESEKEKHLLSEVERTRKPYLESRQRAIRLLVNERKRDEAEAVMVNEALPSLIKYHAAWNEFVEFQKDELADAVKQAQGNYAKSHRLTSLLIGLAVLLSIVIAIFTTRQMTREMTARMAAKNEVSKLNATLEERVVQRTSELSEVTEHLNLRVAALEAAANAIVITDSHDTILWVNHAFTTMTGYSKEEVLGKNPRLLISGDQPETHYAQVWSTISSGEVWKGEIVNRRKDGTTYCEETTITPVTPDVHSPGNRYFISIKQDITDRKLAEDRVQYLAFYDDLTGLPNRTLLLDRSAKAIAEARRQNDKVALLFLDLDKFKDINDSRGHSVGDRVLQEVAERLEKYGREQDTAARLGGDEFLIMLTHVKDVSDAAVAAERLIDAITAEFVIQGQALDVSCSIGISIFPEHGADCETLIKNADAAMYSAKADGRNNFRFFTDNMNAQAVERLILESSLRSALTKEQLFLMYQPQVDIATGRITGLEALLRWNHPELGLVPPDKFIRIAENSGQIIHIGEWVLRTACAQARKWQDEGLPALTVAVNVSAVQFRQESFGKVIRNVLHETGLPPQCLELELTESLLLTNADLTLSVIQKLRAIGVTLAIDDFGTGYSSFSYLRQFQVSKLKIDRSFIRNVAVNPDDAAITAAIISMAKSLHLKVIAEGVEDEAQVSFLRAHQCDEVQGYYFSKPLAVDKVADKLRGTAGHALSAKNGA
jgi:diguanylate cyclase (GGDEF)-like protein/PAS domain S-box-containing protein